MATVTEELERFAVLLEKGLITRQQFDEHRDMLLAQSHSASAAPLSSSLSGTSRHVGAYDIIGHIGDGGMGTVHRGRHRSPQIAARQGGEVAIKVMHPHVARNAEFAERFEREAGLGLKLDHPGIVKVYDLVVDGDVLALAMELVEGRPLSDVIGTQTGPIPWSRAWPMFEQLLDSVSYMHGERVLHRDIKPENVLVTPGGRLKLLDLGIAKDTSSGKTRTGVGMGTVDYMAPEQHTDAGKVDERADVYALGMTLYEMLAGRLPWGDEVDALGILQKKLSGDIPPPTDFYPDIAPEVVHALMGSLANEREARTPNVAALLTALHSAAAGAGGTAGAANRFLPQIDSELLGLGRPDHITDVSHRALTGHRSEQVRRGAAAEEPGPTAAPTSPGAAPSPSAHNEQEGAALSGHIDVHVVSEGAPYWVFDRKLAILLDQETLAIGTVKTGVEGSRRIVPSASGHTLGLQVGSGPVLEFQVPPLTGQGVLTLRIIFPRRAFITAIAETEDGRQSKLPSNVLSVLLSVMVRVMVRTAAIGGIGGALAVLLILAANC